MAINIPHLSSAFRPADDGCLQHGRLRFRSPFNPPYQHRPACTINLHLHRVCSVLQACRFASSILTFTCPPLSLITSRLRISLIARVTKHYNGVFTFSHFRISGLGTARALRTRYTTYIIQASRPTALDSVYDNGAFRFGLPLGSLLGTAGLSAMVAHLHADWCQGGDFKDRQAEKGWASLGLADYFPMQVVSLNRISCLPRDYLLAVVDGFAWRVTVERFL